MERAEPGPSGVRQELSDSNPQPTDVNLDPTDVNPDRTGARPRSGRGNPQPASLNLGGAESKPGRARGTPRVARAPGASHKSSQPTEAESEAFEADPQKTQVGPEQIQSSPEYAQSSPEYAQSSPEYAESSPEYAESSPEYAQEDSGRAQANPERAQVGRRSDDEGSERGGANSTSDEDHDDEAVRSRSLSFKKGQVIFFEEPYAAVLSSSRIKTTCSHCFLLVPTSVPFTPCERCGKVIYCNDQCFAADGPSHAVECEVFMSYEGIPSEYYRLGVRVMSRCLRERARGEVQQSYFFEYERRIDNILSHLKQANDQTIETLRAKAQMMKLRMDRADRIDVSVDELVVIMLKIRVNAHFVYDSASPRVTRLGSALFLAASKMDHTCEQIDRYVLTFSGPNLMLTALESFTIAKSNRLKWNYIQINQSLTERRRELALRYYFNCRCHRCRLEVDPDERNLPMGLEDFMNEPVGDLWEQKARQFFDMIQSFPVTNFFRYSLAYKLQYLCSRRGNHRFAMHYGIAALQGCMRFEEKKQILYMLCHDMAKLGYNNPEHSCNAHFEIVRRTAVDLLTLLFERSHDMVRDLRRLAPRRHRHNIAPRQRRVTT